MFPIYSAILIGMTTHGVLYAQATNGRPAENPLAGFFRAPDSVVEEDLELPPSFTSKEKSHFYYIQYYLKRPDADASTGMHAIGDRAAFYIYWIMVRRPFDVSRTLRALDLLHYAFEKPDRLDEADYVPNKTLELLGILQKTAVEQSVKEGIATLTSFLKALPAKSKERATRPSGIPIIIRLGDAMPHKEDFEPKK